jgi:type III secretion protein U
MSDDKTEKPTQHKLNESRKKGEIAQSQEVTMVAAFGAAIMFLAGAGDLLLHVISQMMEQGIQSVQKTNGEFNVGVLDAIQESVVGFLKGGVLIMLIPAIAAIVAGMVQARGLFSLSPMAFKFERLNPVEGIKKMFGMRQMVNLVKMALKIVAMGIVFSGLWTDALPHAMRTMYVPAINILGVANSLIHATLVAALTIFIIMAVIDYAHQLFEYMKGQRMSKEDIKNEYKSQEGDPHVKGHRKHLAREMVLGNPNQAMTKKASAIVVNPTHVAVGLYYKQGETDLPIVVSKGVDDDAAIIREEARKYNIPLFQNRMLARSLHASVEVGDCIPSELVEPVALVFQWLNGLEQDEAISSNPVNVMDLYASSLPKPPTTELSR